MFNKQDKRRDCWMLNGSFAKKGYDWWWHSLTARNERTGEEKPFFIEYFTCNPALGGAEPVLGQLSENKEKGKRPSYLMVKAGWWGEGAAQLHKFIAWDDVCIKASSPYEIISGDFYASEELLRGSIDISEEESKAHPEYMCSFGSMSWSIRVSKKTAFNVGYGAGGLFRAIKAFEMYWHAEGMKTEYEGEIILNGEKYIVTPETCYGYADKNWGRGFTSPWIWLSSNNLTSKITGQQLDDCVFDIGGGRPKIYFVALERKLLGAFYYKGEEFEYNFSKFWTGSKTDFKAEETEDSILWHVRQENRRSIMESDFSCLKKDMLLVNYEAPDGSKRHNRLWNGGNGVGTIKLYRKENGKPVLIDEIEVRNLGCEFGEYDKNGNDLISDKII